MEAGKRHKNWPDFPELPGATSQKPEGNVWQRESGHYIRGSRFIHLVPSKRKKK